MREGLSSIPSTVTSEPGVMRPATRGKAAEEGSPGTRTATPRRRWPGGSRMRWPPPSISVVSIVAPKPRSIRSVWSRVGSGSITSTPPWAWSPANSTADFTWAEGSGRR